MLFPTVWKLHFEACTLSPGWDRPAPTTATRGQQGIVGLSHWGEVKGSLLGDLEVKAGWSCLQEPQMGAAPLCPPSCPLEPPPHPMRHYVNTSLPLLLA